MITFSRVGRHFFFFFFVCREAGVRLTGRLAGLQGFWAVKNMGRTRLLHSHLGQLLNLKGGAIADGLSRFGTIFFGHIFLSSKGSTRAEGASPIHMCIRSNRRCILLVWATRRVEFSHDLRQTGLILLLFCFTAAVDRSRYRPFLFLCVCVCVWLARGRECGGSDCTHR